MIIHHCCHSFLFTMYTYPILKYHQFSTELQENHSVYVLFSGFMWRSIFHHTTQAIIEAPSKNYWKLHFSMKKTHPSLTTSRNDKHKLTNSLTHHIFTDKISLCTLFINMITCVSFFSGFNLGLINRLEKGWGEGVLNCTPDNKKS